MSQRVTTNKGNEMTDTEKTMSIEEMFHKNVESNNIEHLAEGLQATLQDRLYDVVVDAIDEAVSNAIHNYDEEIEDNILAALEHVEKIQSDGLIHQLCSDLHLFLSDTISVDYPSVDVGYPDTVIDNCFNEFIKEERPAKADDVVEDDYVELALG